VLYFQTAVDRTFPRGPVGIDSCDDTGNFDDVRVSGVKVAKPE
jgi:hypothetical protein